MFQREYIEKILEINGVTPTADDEQIKSVLLSARWHEDDVEAAMVVLRENRDTHKTHVDTLHNVFFTDDHLRPETISSLLGIETNFTSYDIDRVKGKKQQSMTTGVVLQIFLISIALSLILVFAAMWYLQMGIFHPTLQTL